MAPAAGSSALLRVLADEPRWAIVRLLANGDLRVREVVAAPARPRIWSPTTHLHSQQLAVADGRGLAPASRRVGRSPRVRGPALRSGRVATSQARPDFGARRSAPRESSDPSGSRHRTALWLPVPAVGFLADYDRGLHWLRTGAMGLLHGKTGSRAMTRGPHGSRNGSSSETCPRLCTVRR